MRTIERSTAFKRDYKRIKTMPRYKKNLDSLISDVLECLVADKVLPERNLATIRTALCGYFKRLKILEYEGITI